MLIVNKAFLCPKLFLFEAHSLDTYIQDEFLSLSIVVTFPPASASTAFPLTLSSFPSQMVAPFSSLLLVPPIFQVLCSHVLVSGGGGVLFIYAV